MDEHKKFDVFLLPGEFFVGNYQYTIRTLLGSCVSITLWHPHKRIGAMSHYLLAQRSGNTESELSGRYGEEALNLMLEQLAKLGVNGKECQAKIFGGGQMFPGRPDSDVGKKNGDAARWLLQERGITVVSESLFGEGHRKIVFDVNTGDVWSRQVSPTSIVLPQKKETI